MSTIQEKMAILEEDNRVLKADNLVLKDLVATLTSRIADLEAKKHKNSKNSDKPPSSDGLRKGVPKNSRTPSSKKPGGQPGHEGATKPFSPNPDKIVVLEPKTQCDCGGEIKIELDDYTIRQKTDIQPVQVITVEYHAHNGVCTECGKSHKASFPAGISAPVSYGEHIQAIATYLNTYQLLPLKRITELMDDLFGVKISQGTIVSTEHKAYELLSPTESRIKDELINSNVVHFDESGMRVSGKTNWLHSAGTSECTMYAIHSKRGFEAMDDMGILPVFTATAVHDHWKSYYHYEQCAHSECNQHHLRSLKYLYEDLGESWAGEMICLLLRIKKHVDLNVLFGSERIFQAEIEEYEQRYHAILANADDSDTAKTESRRMIKRLKEYKQEALLFMLDFEVPFTNNTAERDIRMPKLKQKISGCFRSEEGANSFARIRGFVSTVKKKGKNVLDGLVSVFKGESTDFLFP